MSPRPRPGAKHTRASPPLRDGLRPPSAGMGGRCGRRVAGEAGGRGDALGWGLPGVRSPGCPLGGAAVRPGPDPDASPGPGPRGYLGPADAQRELGLRAGGRHCGSEGGRRRGVWGSAAATPARGGKLGVPAGARPGPACGSGGRGGRKCSGVRALRSHGLSPASPSTGRTAGRGARGRRRGPVKGTARRASARALAARWTPRRVVPGRGRGVGWARGTRTRGSRAWWAAAAPRLP